MSKTNLFIPQKIKVGFQNRNDTYTGKLAYVIYYDESGKLRKEASWESWRNKEIPDEEYSNEPTEGFVLNKKVGGDNWGWNPRQTYVRVYDPRGFEFEITIPNLLYILECTNSIKGKGLEGEFIYAWDGKDLVLLPTGAPEYKTLIELNNKRFDTSLVIRGKDLKVGYIYLNKYNTEVVYLGRFLYYNPYSIDNPPVKCYWFETLNKEDHINLNWSYDKYKYVRSLPKDYLIDVLSDTPVEDYSNRWEKLQTQREISPIDRSKTKFVPYKTFEHFKRYIDGMNWAWGKNFIAVINDKIQIFKINGREDNYTLSVQDYNGNMIYYDEWCRVKLFDSTYSLQAIYDMYHPCYEETYLTNGRLYERKYYAE